MSRIDSQSIFNIVKFNTEDYMKLIIEKNLKMNQKDSSNTKQEKKKLNINKGKQEISDYKMSSSTNVVEIDKASKVQNKKLQKWTEEETQALSVIVQQLAQEVNKPPAEFGQEDWVYVASFIPTRNFVQCQSKYYSTHRQKKGKAFWTEQEDLALKQLVQKYGEKQWAKIAESLTQINIGTQRFGKQCRERYLNKLAPNLSNNNSWTEEEDRIITEQYQQIGGKWTIIAKLLPGKSEMAVKNRFYNLEKKRKVACEEAKKASLYLSSYQNNTHCYEQFKSSQISTAHQITPPIESVPEKRKKFEDEQQFFDSWIDQLDHSNENSFPDFLDKNREEEEVPLSPLSHYLNSPFQNLEDYSL